MAASHTGTASTANLPYVVHLLNDHVSMHALRCKALTLVQVNNQHNVGHSLQAQSHSAGTFDEAIFSRYIFRNVCAGAPIFMLFLRWTRQVFICFQNGHMHGADKGTTKGQGKMTPLLCLLSL